MTIRRPSTLVDHLRSGPDASDGQLLEWFVARRDEAAFAALMRRHGPMVLGVCRRVLGNAHDAEDAFQAAFLVLVRKAAELGPRQTLGDWLYGVAYHTALKARASAMKRRAREAKARRADQALAEDVSSDWRALLDQELSRLPERFRAAVVLCDLEGRPRKEAARQLGVPEGTLSSRLATGRKALAARLTRRGLTLSGGLLAAVLSRSAAAAGVPPPLATSTVKAATGTASAPVAALTEGVLKAMLLGKLKIATVVLLLGGLAAATAGALVYHAAAAEPAHSRRVARDDKPSDPPKPSARLAAVLKDAKQAAESIEDQQWKAWILQAVGEEQARGGDRAAAAKTFQAAIEAAKQIQGPNPDDRGAPARHTLTWIAVAQAEAGDLKSALETVKGIDNDGDRDYGLAQVAVGQARGGDPKGALETAEGVSFNRKDWVLTAVVKALAGAGKVDEAAKTAEKISGEQHRVAALTAVAEAQARARDREAARKSVQAALKIADRITEDENTTPQTASYVAIVRAQAELGDAKEARQTADAIKKEPWKSIALHSLAAAQARAGDVKGAERTAEDIAAEYYQGEALKDILTEGLRPDGFKAGLEKAAAIKSVFWRVAALAEIAKAEAKAGERPAAAETFRQAFAAAGRDGENVRDEESGLGGLRDAALSLIVRSQAEAGQEEEALAWALKRSSALLKAQALLNVARGLSAREHQK